MAAASLPQGGIRLGVGEGQAYWLLTDLFTFKVLGEDTNGAYSVAEVDAGPELGPPPHVHRDADESFYILEGTFDFSLAGAAFSAGPGAFVHLPKGVVHTHRAGGGASARALVIQSPAGVERFIAEAGTRATDTSARPSPPSMPELERIVAIAAKYRIEVPPPA
ncbi:MAG TPA: cupin domain-containing protein [Vicinamibacterales bacterium]|nr:cupin domain-containing protein [Vicinamibacterales bacterium]